MNDPEEISGALFEEQLTTLAEMLGEIPVSEEWIECSKKLTGEQKFRVHARLDQLRKQREKERLGKMSDADRANEKAKEQAWSNSLDTDSYIGNMGQPATPEEYKSRYGTYPPGYVPDKN